MGLSDEERLSKFYFSLMGWRSHLVKLQRAVRKTPMYHGGDAPAEIVGHWIATLDEMVGKQIVASDANSGYWLLGPNEHSYAALFHDTYGLAHENNCDWPHKKIECDSLEWHRRNLSLNDLAEHLTSGGFHCDDADEVKRFALWWTQWNYVAAVLYPVCRYEDELFAPLLERLTRLLGEMSNRRYEVVSEQGELPRDNDFEHLVKLENALLCKFRVLCILLEREDAKHWPSGKPNKARFDRALKATCRDRFDIGPIYQRLGNMSLTEVASFLEKEEMDKYKRDRARHDNQKEEKRVDGVLGPTPRSQEELEKIIETSTDPDEVERASQEAEKVYGLTIGGARRRIEELRKKAKK